MIMQLTHITPEIAQSIAERLGIPRLFSRGRGDKETAHIRQRVQYLLLRNPHINQSMLGRATARDRTTIIRAKKIVARRLARDVGEAYALVDVAKRLDSLQALT